MNRERAETHLRLLAEATMRRLLAAGPRDAGGHRSRLQTVGQALIAVGALDAATFEEILVDFNLAMTVRRLPEPGQAAQLAHWITQGQSIGSMPVAWAVRTGLALSPGSTGPRSAGSRSTGPRPPARSAPARPEPARPAPGATGPGGGQADRIVPVGLEVPFRDGDVSGALYLMSFARTGAGTRFFAVWDIRTPALQDAALIPLGLFTATDDRGTPYELDFTPGGRTGWTSEIGLHPVPPPGIRWLDITAPGGPAVRVDLSRDPACSRAARPPQAGQAQVRDARLSPGELLLVMLAERLLTAVPEPSNDPLRPLVTPSPPALRMRAAALGDLIAALEAADVLSPLSPVPARLATLCASLNVPEHGIAAPPAHELPEPWLSALSHFQRRKPEPASLREGCAAVVAALPELDGIQLTLLGLHHSEGSSSLHVLARGLLPESPLGPFGIDLTFPLSIWLRDSGGRWHAARPADRRKGGSREPECTVRLQLVPPLTRATEWIEVLARGQSAEVRTTLPLRWGCPS